MCCLYMEAYCNLKNMYEVDVFVGNDTIIDQEVYELWLEGYSSKDAVTALQQRGALQQTGATPELLMADTLDQYRMFHMLERLLQYPTKLSEEWTFQIAPQTQKMLIQKYYEFDDDVVREILGKKLAAKTRKDLDEVSEKTRVSLKSCHRQFDNVKRVFRHLDQMRGALVHNIQAQFLLPESLAKKYAAIVFIAYNRFETSRRKLIYLTFSDFYFCANLIHSKWSCSASVTGCKSDETDADIDKDFLQDLRDLKVLLDKEHLEEHRGFVCRNLHGKLTTKMYGEIESNFKNMSRTIVSIASGLIHAREARDLFVDLVEKFIDPCKQMRMSREELDLFLTTYSEAAQEMTLFKSMMPHLITSWDRYMHTTTQCILHLYR